MLGFFKKSGIYFDTKPKKGSVNVVTSDGIYKAIESLKKISFGSTTTLGALYKATRDLKGKEGFLYVGGSNTMGNSYRNLYMLSYERRGNTPVIKLIMSGLGEITDNPVQTISANRSGTNVELTIKVLDNYHIGEEIMFVPI